MAIASVWCICQKDIINATIAFISMPVIILGYSLLKTLENETKKSI